MSELQTLKGREGKGINVRTSVARSSVWLKRYSRRIFDLSPNTLAGYHDSATAR